MSHLASRSEGHRQHAKLCFEEIIKYIGSNFLKLFKITNFYLLPARNFQMEMICQDFYLTILP